MNNELYEKLTRLQWLFHIQQMNRYHRGGHLADTTRGQGRILAALQMRDGISTKDLSYLLGLAVSSLNEFLSKLEKGGYIIREQSEQDKRVILVKLTEKGRSQKSQSEETADMGEIFECFSNDEQITLGIFLDKLIDVLGEKLGFGYEELEWLKAANTERDRLFAEMGEAGMRSFDPHTFRGGFGGFSNRRGFPHGHGGFPHGFHNRDNNRRKDKE